MTDRTCTIEGCDRAILCHGWCRPHYRRWSAYGDPEYVRPPASAVPCSIEGCEGESHAKGWCKSHYERWRTKGDPEWVKPSAQPKTCAVEGCDRESKSRGWCTAHYFRWKRTGDPGAAELNIKGLPKGPCHMDDCDKPVASLGLCERHYYRYKKWGDPFYFEEKARLGQFNRFWRGNDCGYSGAHDRVTRTWGAPASAWPCVDCGDSAAHWSYDHADPDERVGVVNEVSLPYSLKVEHYDPRCVPCHKRFDLDVVATAAS